MSKKTNRMAVTHGSRKQRGITGSAIFKAAGVGLALMEDITDAVRSDDQL